MVSGIWLFRCHGIYAFRLTAPWFSAYEAIHAMRFMRLDWQLHGFRHMKPPTLKGLSSPVTRKAFLGPTQDLPKTDFEKLSWNDRFIDKFWLNRSLLCLCCAIAQNEVLEAHSSHIWHQATKMLKMSLLRLILAISGARQLAQSRGAFDLKSPKSWSFWLKEPKVGELLT